MTSNTKTTKSNEKRETKAALVERLLKARNGATIGQLVEATGWQPHTSRAFLTGLRKKGHNLIKDQRKDGTTSYCIRSAKSAPADEPHDLAPPSAETLADA